MTERYLGSIISSSPVEPSSNLSNATASGVWNIHDPLIFGQAGDWPDYLKQLPFAATAIIFLIPLILSVDFCIP